MATETGFIQFVEGSAPSTPGTGKWRIYTKSTGLYVVDDAGTEYGPLAADGAAAHIADASDAHDASAISLADAGGNTSETDVEGAIDELYGLVGAGTGSVLQVVVGTLTGTDVSTTAATFQDSGLSATITPVSATSLLLITVHGECRAERVAGTISPRYGWVAIRNDTDAVMVVEQVRGRNLISGVTSQAEGFWPIALQGAYTVNSTTARTFKLQYKASEATNSKMYILTASPRNQAIMTIMEVAA